MSSAINDRPERVSIVANGDTLGRTRQRMSARPTSLAQVYLAGFAAEHVLTGRRPRNLDREIGLGVLAHVDPDLITMEGVELSDGYGAVREVLRTGIRDAEDDIRREVERFYEIAWQSVRAVWPGVKAVAHALLDHHELDRHGLDRALGEGDIFAPVLAIQMAHGLPVQPAVESAGPLMEVTSTRTPKQAGSTISRDAAAERAIALLDQLRRDPEWASVVAAYDADALKPGRKFGKNGLKTASGKLFALFTQETLVVKLPRSRVAELVAQGVGTPFDPGHGRLMKEWLAIEGSEPPWIDLVREAFTFVERGRA